MTNSAYVVFKTHYHKERYIGLDGDGRQIETDDLSLAKKFQCARDAYEWAGKQVALAYHKVGRRPDSVYGY